MHINFLVTAKIFKASVHTGKVGEGMEHFFMINEIKEIPQSLRLVLGSLNVLKEVSEEIVNKDYKRVFIIGCGSSYYAALAGIYPVLGLDLDAYSMPSSEFLLYALGKVNRDTVLVGVSRSGETSETVEAVKASKKRGALTVGVTCNRESKLAEISAKQVCLDIGEERSIVMTKTFSALAFANILLGLLISSQREEKGSRALEEAKSLPETAKLTVERTEDLVKRYAKEYSDFKNFIYLGSGPSYSTCLEGALKLKETSYVMTEALPTLEFRHGSMAIVGEEKVKIVLLALKGSSLSFSLNVASDIVKFGGKPLVITNYPEGCEKFTETIGLPIGTEDTLTPPVAIIPLQLFAYYYCLGRGLNPDEPRNLSRFVAKF